MKYSTPAVRAYESPRELPEPRDKDVCEGYFTIINPHCRRCERMERCRGRSKVVQLDPSKLRDMFGEERLLQTWRWKSIWLNGLRAREPVKEGV